MASILFLLSDLEMGGSQKKIINVANQLRIRQRDVHVCVLGGPYTLHHMLDKAVPYTDFQRSTKFEWPLVGAIKQYVREHAISEVCIIGAYPLMYVIPALRFMKNRPRLSMALNSTFFRDHKERLQMCLYIPLMQFLDYVIFGCKYQEQHWKSHYRVGNRESRVIYNGIDTAHYTLDSIGDTGNTVRIQHGIKKSDIVIGSVGKFRPEKGYEYLIEATHILKNRGLIIKILLVGTGIQEQYLRDRIVEKGLENQVIFFGETTDVRAALAAMDVFVLSSVAVETFSNAALEAMAMSRPVVLSRLSGAPEMIEEGVQGLLYPPEDSAALAGCIEQLVDQPLRDSMGAAARQHVVEHFSIGRMVTDYEACFGLL